ncbi:hypothetical protein ACEN9X_09415 [Mucilaginibacter sp. Mucisp86]|uniref:hypothetical protein n=1 Tax=Mucilaginibacter sp. Mucisp86 TaxID=3243060 RepID=UPI0039B3A59C
MKPINQLTNVEMGRYIHQLFPEEMPQFIDYAKSVSEFVQQDAKNKKWENDFLPPQLWMDIAKHTEQVILKYGVQLHKNSRLFSDQLFDGFNAIFIMHCLRLYTTTQQLANRKFSLAVDLFFNP